jgi:hypothetical protein
MTSGLLRHETAGSLPGIASRRVSKVSVFPGLCAIETIVKSFLNSKPCASPADFLISPFLLLIVPYYVTIYESTLFTWCTIFYYLLSFRPEYYTPLILLGECTHKSVDKQLLLLAACLLCPKIICGAVQNAPDVPLPSAPKTHIPLPISCPNLSRIVPRISSKIR